MPVNSSAVRSVGFDDGVLEVEYASGHVYRMTGISPEQHDALITHESIGKALHALRPEAKAITKVEPEAET